MRYRAGVRARSVALRANLRLLFLAPATVLESLRAPPSRFSGLRAPLRYGCPPWATHLSLPWDMRYRAGVRSLPSAFILQDLS